MSKLIREQLGELIGRELEFPDSLVTVNEVSISKKLDAAKVLVSVYPTTHSFAALRILEDARRGLQFQLSRKLNVRAMPELLFQLDSGTENAAQVEKALLAHQDTDET